MIHGDLAPYHIILDSATRQIAGVLDFGTAGWGDPAADIAALLLSYGEAEVLDMAKTYPVILGTLERARFLAGATEVLWAVTGLRTGDVSWLTCHLGFARD